MTTGDTRPNPSYQHPLFQPDKRYVPPLALRATSEGESTQPATTFDEILPTQPPLAGAQQPTTDTSPHARAQLKSQPPQVSSLNNSRTSRFFALFRSSSSNKDRQPQARQSRKTRSQERRERRQRSRERGERARQHRAHRKEAEKRERTQKQWLGGVAWGFDPDAGQGQSLSGSDGHDVRRSHSTTDEEFNAGGPSRPGGHEGSRSSGSNEVHMGVETGGPGREGQFEYGQLRSRPGHWDVIGKHATDGKRRW